MHSEDKIFAGVAVFVAFIYIVGISVAIWAIIQLVQWVTSK